jgi:hypothetical protein
MNISNDGRYYIHNFPENTPVDVHLLLPTLSRAIDEIRDMLTEHVNKRPEGRHEHGTYTGLAGILLSLYSYNKSVWIPSLEHHRISFTEPPTVLGGDLLIAIVMEDLESIRSFYRAACFLIPSECELLNGRAGCLSGLLLSSRINPDMNFDAEISHLASQIIDAGKRTDDVLMYEWHGKEYLGAIHGIAGILYVLLQVREEILLSIDSNISARIEKTVDCMLSNHTLPSGNIKSSTSSHTDRLVHFCHGATGWIPLLCLLSERISSKRSLYLAKAKSLGDVVWRRGLLATKGPGLCHGISGSICSLVDLYRASREEVWMNRAEHFSLFLAREWKNLAPKADRPFSLFEGVSGAFYVMNVVLSERLRAPGSFQTSFPCL